MQSFKPYGLKFKPIVKDKIWGGSKLKDLLGKPASKEAGESWEISAVDGDISEVNNGIYQGWSFDKLIKSFQEEILGKTVIEKFGGEFPLLIKYIDAAKNLSVQVHPDDKMAKKEHNSFGKTEMWYIMQADDGAMINVGWKTKIDTAEYIDSLKKGKITDYLNFIQVDKGDTFFIKAGTIHAIGAGVLLAEIQQTSDVTYRVYDWDRVDDSGKSRELHVDLAAQAMNFSTVDDYTVNYKAEKNRSESLVDCDFFTTNIIKVKGVIKKDYSSRESFVVYMCVSGQVKIDTEGEKETLEIGQSILIPSIVNSVEIEGEGELLEVYISN